MNTKARVCIISPEIVGPHKNGGVGTHCYYLSAFLSQQLGQEVTFLYTGEIERKDEKYWRDWFRSHLGIEFVWLAPPKVPKAVPDSLRCSYVQSAREVYHWLRERSFDVCHFQEMLAHGFDCFRAKRLGLAFRDTVLTCTVHSSWEWIRQAMHTFPQYGAEELHTKFMERYCIEHCDLLVSPSQYMLDWVRENRVPACPCQTVLPYLFDPNLKPVGHRPVNRHMVFFGRLEVRKGLLIFLEALKLLDEKGTFAKAPIKVTFLGKSGYTPGDGGQATIEAGRKGFSPHVELELLTDLDHHEAMAYLSEHNDALVVCPSLVDNSPFAIIESLQLGLNVIAAGTGGIPELFQGTERLFDPNPAALAQKIGMGLDNKLPAPAKRYTHQGAAEVWTRFCEGTVAKFQASTPPIQKPLGIEVYAVAAGVTAPEMVDSLQAQANVDFAANIVENPGAPLPEETRRACDKRGWRVINAAELQSAATAPGDAQGKYLAVVAPGAVLKPNALGRLAQCLEFSGADGLSCWAQIGDSTDGNTGYVHQPLGPCLEGGYLDNLLGAGCVMINTRNFPLDATSLHKLTLPHGIWAFLAGLAGAGKKMDVVPECLVSLPQDFPLMWQQLDYPGHMDVINACSHNAPVWVHYTLVNTVELRLRDERVTKEMQVFSQFGIEPVQAVGVPSLSKRLFVGMLGRKLRRSIRKRAAKFFLWLGDPRIKQG